MSSRPIDTYEVKIYETVVHRITVTATSEDEARDLAFTQYHDLDENNLGDSVESHEVESEGSSAHSIDKL